MKKAKLWSFLLTDVVVMNHLILDKDGIHIHTGSIFLPLLLLFKLFFNGNN